MTGSVLPRLWPPSWVKSRLCPAAELQGGHTPVSRVGLGHGNALKLDPLVCHRRFFSSSRRRHILPSHPGLCFTTVAQTLEELVRFFFVLSFLLVAQCHYLFFYMLTALTFLFACRFASSRSEVSASMHNIDVVLDCWVGFLARTSFLPIRVCLLATYYLLEKMTEPMQVNSAYNCKDFHLMF